MARPDIPYDIANLHVEYVQPSRRLVPTGFLARCRPQQQCVRHRKLHRELARKAGKTP